MKKNAVTADAGAYLFATLLTQAITLAAGILTRRFMGPAQTGVWALLQILLAYSPYILFGVPEAISREIPFYRGQGDAEEAERIKNRIFSFSMLMTTVYAVAILVYAAVNASRFDAALFEGLLFAAPLLLLQRWSDLNIAFLRGYKLFSLASKQMIFSAIANALFVSLLAWKYQIRGFLTGMALSFVFNLAFIRLYHRFRFRPQLDAFGLRRLISYGFPLMIAAFLATFFLTIDKIMVARFLGLEALGLYSVALMAYTYLNTVPNAVGIVLIPNLHELYGKTGTLESLSAFLDKSTNVFLAVMPLVISFVWFWAPLVVHLLLPRFVPCIPAMRALILAGFFLALAHPYNYFLAVVRKQNLLVAIMVVVCGAAFALIGAAICTGGGIAGVAIAMTAATFVHLTLNYIIVSGLLKARGEYVRRYFLFILQFVRISFLLTLAARFLSESDVRSAILGSFILIGCYIPDLILIQRRYSIFTVLFQQLRLGRQEEASV